MNQQPDDRNRREDGGGKGSSDADLLATIPAARIVALSEFPESRTAWFGSRVWWLAVAALLVAVGLVWWSLPANGLSIKIHFPEGHGLQMEDVVRFRGIDVGEVRDVKLNADLSGVDVVVGLKPFAAQLARDGTRFWIVRPELSLSGISGLETAVGHKYIGLLPGSDDGAAKFSFEGLSEIPPDAKAELGFEIIIRGDRRHSISTGSPVNCRGVEVGRVLSVGLSRNARFVDVRARIYERYRNFLNSETRFWASSGVDVDFTIGGGFKLQAESLETIARGGVAMLTISDEGTPVNAGQVFKLYDQPEDGWLAAAENVRINDIQLGFAIPLQVTWKEKGLFRTSTEVRSFGGIPVLGDGGVKLLVPSDMLEVPENAIEGSFMVSLVGQNKPVADSQQLAAAQQVEGTDGLLSWLAVADGAIADGCELKSDFRTAETVEDCLAVRAAGEPGGYEYLHYPIDKDLLFVDSDSGDQMLRFFDGDKNIWHGSPVQSVADGKIIGVLLTDEKRTVIVGAEKIR